MPLSSSAEKVLQPYWIFGRNSPRVVNPFVDFHEVLKHGMVVNGLIKAPEDPDEDEDLNEDEKAKKYALIHFIIHIYERFV